MQITKEQLKAVANESKREYDRKWRDANREYLREYYRKWHAAHPGAQAEYNRRFKERLALKKIAAENGVSVEEIEVI